MSLITIALLAAVVSAATAFTLLRSDSDLIVKSITGAIAALILATIISQETVTTIDGSGVSLRRRFSFNIFWSFEDISRAEPCSYKAATKEYGKWALVGSAIHLLHNDGVLFHLSDGTHSFFSSKRAHDFVNAINSGRAVFESRKYE